MRIELKSFQSDYVKELRDTFLATQEMAEKWPSAVLLNAPTGSGKTVMATALIEQLLDGDEDTAGDPEFVFVWLTDDPELNKQTKAKMLDTSSLLREDDVVLIDATLDVERLTPGRVYLLNTDKLGAGATTYVKQGDDRTFTIWQMLSNTVNNDPTRFVLIIDEAHRGAKGKKADEADTIMQRFMKGNGQIPRVPLVLGVSATPERFVKLCTDTNRPLRRVDVDPEAVRESGLLKEWVDLYHPDEAQHGDVTMLIEAVADWKRYRDRWLAHDVREDEEVPEPVMLVQVEDAAVKSQQLSKTDLGAVVGTIAKEMGDVATDNWIAHAFQDDVDFTVGGYTVRKLAPSKIDADPDVKVVLFKTSLNTGWDCPRAEVMVSFRTARDETNIAQLVGRMVRTPLARRIEADEFLNTVALYLPFYDRKTVEKVVNRITGDAGIVPPTGVRDGYATIALHQATDSDRANCFAMLAALPTYTVPRVRPMKPVPRLAKLASLIAEVELDPNPVKTYRAALVAVLSGERERLKDDEAFKQLVDEASVLNIRRRRVAYGTVAQEVRQAAATAVSELADDDGKEQVPETEIHLSSQNAADAVRAVIAEHNVDDLYRDAGRVLGEGLHKEYLRAQIGAGNTSRTAKLELHALVSSPGVLARLNDRADELRKLWVSNHKAAINGMGEKVRQALREVEAAGADPEQTTVTAPPFIDGTKAAKEWPKHLYIYSDGKFYEDFSKSSWERKTVESELARNDVVGWLRNPDRKPWSLCVPRREATKWVPFYPDFLFFRNIANNVIADIVDPHLLAAEDMPQRAVWLAHYASKHSDQYGRIEMVIYENINDASGKRLDLTNENTRNKVAAVTTREQLKSLFGELT